MKKTSLLFLVIPLVIFSFLLGNEAFLGFSLKNLTEQARAGTADNVYGWAWSENIGWISFNCNNPELPEPRCTNDYGVNIDTSTGLFSGYAWSENIGWVSFNSSELVGCPSGTCEAKASTTTGEVSGWARALAYGDGWNGWIKLRDTDYGVWIDSSVSPSEFRNWAWSDMVIGWISFNDKDYNGAAGPVDYQVMTDFVIDTTSPTVEIRIFDSANNDITETKPWLKANTYTIKLITRDETELKSSEYYIKAFDIDGNFEEDIVPLITVVLSGKEDTISLEADTGKDKPDYWREGDSRYLIYFKAKDKGDNDSTSAFRYLNFDFTPPTTEIR